jgi:hypothetical protein
MHIYYDQTFMCKPLTVLGMPERLCRVEDLASFWRE